jgi:hypothetical protein
LRVTWHAERVTEPGGHLPQQPSTGTADPRLVADRAVPRVYRVSGRADIHEFLLDAVRQSGGTVLYATSPTRVPVYLGLEDQRRERLGLMVYPFRMKRLGTRNRPGDEIRGQLRYGAEETWPSEDHFVARDIAGVDTTLLIGVDPREQLIIGLDPSLYDPLPLGISVYAKDRNAAEVREHGWTAWERVNRAGQRRAAPRAAEGLETLVGFGPERLLDYARFERDASDLGLDPPLRYAAAISAARPAARGQDSAARRHRLEQEFDLDASVILDIVGNRKRLQVAVKGGVAEHHLGQILRQDPAVASVTGLDLDAQPDFRVLMTSGREVLVECKNVSPERFANGDFRVEVQKTRASKDDPAGRLYRPEQFDVVAACLFSPTRSWEFRFILSSALARHSKHPERLAATHHVDDQWSPTLQEALDRVPGAP